MELMDVVRPLCEFCRNRASDGTLRCRAFPDGIPEDIITQDADHRAPYTGDGGIMFETDGTSAKDIAEMFGPVRTAGRVSSVKSRVSLLRVLRRQPSSTPDDPAP